MKVIIVTDGKATIGAGSEISKAAQGTTITLTANAAPDGKVFDKWVVESGGITLTDANSATTTFTMPAGEVKVKANYKDVPHTGGGSHSSSIQKPTIIAGEGAETSLSILGTNLTIKVTEGYELTDVILNGVSKGKVTELTGLRTGDKVEVKTEKKQEKPSKEEIIAALDNSKLVARSKLITLENGKKAVRVTWYDQNGNEITDLQAFAHEHGITVLTTAEGTVQLSEKETDPLASARKDGYPVISNPDDINSYLSFCAKLPSWLPDGYTFFGATAYGDQYLFVYYKNQEGNYIMLDERILNEETAFSTGTDGVLETASVNGNSAVLLDGTSLNWETDDISIGISSRGLLSREELFKLAESIQ